jgi:rod shape-determining protein MreD
MRNLLAFPILILVVILQSAVVGRITLLSGYADLMLIVLAAWALQENVDTAWHWAILGGFLIGFVSHLIWVVPVAAYLVEVGFAQALRRRVWQAPLLAMFTVVFLSTLIFHAMSLVVLQLSGNPLSISAALRSVTLPSLLLNMLFAIPVFAVMRDLSRWIYPLEGEI